MPVSLSSGHQLPCFLSISVSSIHSLTTLHRRVFSKQSPYTGHICKNINWTNICGLQMIISIENLTVFIVIWAAAAHTISNVDNHNGEKNCVNPHEQMQHRAIFNVNNHNMIVYNTGYEKVRTPSFNHQEAYQNCKNR